MQLALTRVMLGDAGQPQLVDCRGCEVAFNEVVRQYGFYYRYDADLERRALNRAWHLVNSQMKHRIPTIKPSGYGSTRNGRRKRLYDWLRTPFDRLLDASVLSPQQVKEMTTYRYSLNPKRIAAEIARVQNRPPVLSAKKAEQLYVVSFSSALPDVRKGVRVTTGSVSRAYWQEALRAMSRDPHSSDTDHHLHYDRGNY